MAENKHGKSYESEHKSHSEPEHKPAVKSAEAPEVQAAPTPGTAILGTATIDSLFTLVYGTRSTDLSATPTYSWATGTSIIGQWPSVISNGVINNSCIVCRFEARQMSPSTISQ